MKVNLIPKLAIESLHPKDMKCSTDMEYAKIATEVAKEMANLNIPDISADGLRVIALHIAMYFEDIVADAGIWRSFTELVQKEQGKPVPFFEVDKDNYYPDEPNIADLKFLVWYTMLLVHHGRVGNPESPVITDLAEAAFKVLDRNFETVSVNETLKTYLTGKTFVGDFYHQRNMLKWLAFSCYLTYVPDLSNRLFNEAQELARHMNGDIGGAFYIRECLMPYTYRIGPLELLPQKWAETILRVNGNKKGAKIIGGQRYMDYAGYHVTSSEAGKSLTLESISGDTFTVDSADMNNPQADSYEKSLVIGSFVEYNGKWNLNGDCAWGDNLAPFNEMHDEYVGREKMKKAYAKLRKDTAIYYFADNKALEKFLIKNLPFSDEVKKNFKLPEGQNIALYIPEDYHDDFMILPDAALCLKDEKNPYYNQKMALNQALNLALSLRREVRDYAIAHNLLPDATINSSQGLQRGNEIVQKNFSFLVRAVMSRL